MFNQEQMPSITVEDFSGGCTDSYLGARPNQYKRADNLLINDEKKLEIRPGSQVADPANTIPGILGTNPRVGALFEYRAQIFEISGKRVFYNNGTYQELLGPTGNSALGEGSETNHVSVTIVSNQVYVTSDVFARPKKIYKDSLGAMHVVNAGLPALESSPTVAGSIASVLAFANDIKAKFNTHLASGPAHTTSPDAVNTVTSPNATNLATLITLVTEMISDYDAHEGDSELAAAWVFHAAQESFNHSLSSLTAPTTLAQCVTKLNELKSRLNDHINDTPAHGVATTNVTLADSELHNYGYMFVRKHTYTVGDSTFSKRSATTLVLVEEIDEPSTSSVSIAAIPVLANGATENYAVSDIKVEVYRTLDAGATFYFVGEVTNGTTTYNDTASDASIEGNTIIYTDGGVLDYDAPPLCKVVFSAGGKTFYLHTKESGVTYPNRVRQSIPGDPDSCPGSLYKDVEDDLVGGGAAGSIPVVGCAGKIYRLEGGFDDFGQGDIQAVEISRRVGMLSHAACVSTNEGLFFAGTDGFYFTDGYRVTKISDDLNTRYKDLINVSDSSKAKNITGVHDGLRNRIWWGVQSDSGSLDNDSCFVAHLKFGIGPETPFTTLSGSDDFAPTALLYYTPTKQIYRADKRGYLFRHDGDVLTDPKVDVTKDADEWLTSTIIYDYVSAGFDFGSGSARKWVPKIVLYAKNASNISAAINSINDDSSESFALQEVKILSNLVWGDSTVTWGDSTITWNFNKLIEALRRFPAAGGLRCSYKQIQITNSLTYVDNSDASGTATLDQVAKTLTLNTAPDNAWPVDSVDYYVSFDSDDYTENFLVTDRSASVLTFADPENKTVSSASRKWVIRGYKKGDVLSLLSYSIFYAQLTATQKPFRGVIGENQ